MKKLRRFFYLAIVQFFIDFTQRHAIPSTYKGI